MNYTSVNFLLPPEGVFVHTKIDDENGERCQQIMKRKGSLWFTEDGLYVYFTPTHWAYIEHSLLKDKWTPSSINW